MPKKKLKPQHEIVVDELAKGKTQTEAYQKAYPKSSYNAARSNAVRLIAKDNISEALQERIQRALTHHQVTPEEVIGSAVFQMRSSMRDILNEKGSFDFKKACKTGAVDLLKKHKETIKTTINEDGLSETTRIIEVELLSNQDGRKEVANYIGVENAPKQNLTELTDEEFARELYNRLLALRIKDEEGNDTDIPKWTPQKAKEELLARYPGVELDIEGDVIDVEAE